MSTCYRINYHHKTWTIYGYPLPDHPTITITGTYRAASTGICGEEVLDVKWPSIGAVSPEETRRFMALGTEIADMVEEAKKLLGDGRLVLRKSRLEDGCCVEAVTGTLSVTLHIYGNEVEVNRHVGCGFLAQLWSAWAADYVRRSAACIAAQPDGIIET